ncbi:MAG: hypothetical protein F4030_09635 [Gammaproteobacteria bacterium]|nr:hypothetical protein [Gammaproteobacteria bacterium]MYH86893.1 hypothetical protein [Gammaproteobacteria bacterium]MYK05229.1 hypothetical protein [Gammaproteobacteria bacterium]
MNNRQLSLVNSSADSAAAEKKKGRATKRVVGDQKTGGIEAGDSHSDERFCRLPRPLLRALETQTDEQLESIVVKALECAGGGKTKSARQSLAAAIDGNRNIKIRGFAKASKAKPELLTARVLEECLGGDDRLLGAVLRTWRSANAPLRERVENHLAEIEVEPEGADFKNGVFPRVWVWSDWSREVGKLLDGQGKKRDVADAAAGEARLMLSLVSGAAPARPGEIAASEIESPLLQDFLQALWNSDLLEELGPGLGAFLDAVEEIADDFAASRILDFFERADALIESLSGDFQGELAYLEIDLNAILSELKENRELLMLASESHPAEMVELLRDYRELRPQGGSAREERERGPKRGKLEKRIAELHEQWQTELERCKATLEERGRESAAGVDGEDPAGLPPAEETAGEEAESIRGELLDERRRLADFRDKYEDLKSRYGDLSAESRKLKRRCAALERQKEEWEETHGQLEEKLALTESAADAEKAEGARESAAAYLVRYPPERLESVMDAVSQAKRTYSGQLLFALNSKSQENSGFQRPAEVFAALAWLATEFRNSKLDPDAGPVEYNERIKSILPNWFYIPRQSPTARGKYPDWYTTTVNGTSHELQLHVGKGKSHDAKSNIRIAFAWDEAESRIVVGYIGRHQRTGRS